MRQRTKPITMLEKRFSYFPQRFLANGIEFNVTAVQRTFTLKDRLVFDVKCHRVENHSDSFRLVYLLKQQTWMMEVF